MIALNEEIREEYEHHRPTGIELEELGERRSASRLVANPDTLRIERRSFALGHIVNKIKDREIDLAPPLPKWAAWKRLQKVRLVESTLLRIPLPPLYFSIDAGGAMHVVHGLTHLSTVTEFINGSFPLDSDKLTYLSGEPGVSGETFGHLAPFWKRRILNTRAIAYLLNASWPLPIRFDIVERLHMGGNELNGQEIRHLLCGRKTREFLADLVESPAFRSATQGIFYRHLRQADVQVALRFAAFRMLADVSEYDENLSMDMFLTQAAERIDRDLFPARLKELRADFDRAMDNARTLFGERAFRKWPLGDDRVHPINRALLESWSVALADCDQPDLQARKPAIVHEARLRMRDDHAYMQAITSATGDAAKVKLRFQVARQILQAR